MARVALAVMFVLSTFLMWGCEYEEKHYPDRDYYYWGPQRDSHPGSQQEHREHE